MFAALNKLFPRSLTTGHRSPVKIAVTGHIDHGKSTLIGRLLLDTKSLPADRMAELEKISKSFGKETELAYLADQLKEEREKNITIDTTEITLKTGGRTIGLIDTPGHLEFIKNMLTGSSRADAAILIVDATKGIEEQTRRHAFLLKLLSLQPVVVLINKMDAVENRQAVYDKLKHEIETLFQKLKLVIMAVVPVSAKTGSNISHPDRAMTWYQGPQALTILQSIRRRDDNSAEEHVRFPVQDVYEMGGETLAVGKILSGTLRLNQTLTVLPANQTVNVASIKIFGQNPASAKAGQCVGITLTPAVSLRRGHQLIDPESQIAPVTTVTATLFWLGREPLKINDQVSIRISTQDIPARVTAIEERIDPSTLESLDPSEGRVHPHEAARLRFQLESPAVAEDFHVQEELGRFVIERDQVLLGAGTIHMTDGAKT